MHSYLFPVAVVCCSCFLTHFIIGYPSDYPHFIMNHYNHHSAAGDAVNIFDFPLESLHPLSAREINSVGSEGQSNSAVSEGSENETEFSSWQPLWKYLVPTTCVAHLLLLISTIAIKHVENLSVWQGSR